MAIKRHLALQPFSHEHHHGLVLCRKVTQGLDKKIDPLRIKQYTDWFYKNYLQRHFELEEKYIFPILPKNHPLIVQALEEHQIIKQLFLETKLIKEALEKIPIMLNAHIRFEERQLFNQIQQIATTEQLDWIEKHHNYSTFTECTKDQFWQ